MSLNQCDPCSSQCLSAAYNTEIGFREAVLQILCYLKSAFSTLSTYRLLSLGSTNSNVVKASAGSVAGWYITNTSPSVRYVKLYNKATAPTVGADVPKLTLAIPGSSSGNGSNFELPKTVPFTTGIGVAITTGPADTDTNAVGANEVIVNLFYK